MNDSERVRAVYDQARARRRASPTLDRLDAELRARLGIASPDGSLTHAEVEWVAQRLQLDAPQRLLDIACGSGALTRELSVSARCRAVGTELLFERVVAGVEGTEEHANGIYFVQADASQGLCFHADCFDAVTLFDALVHFEDKEKLLGEISRVLCRAGRFAISTILGANLPSEQAQLLEETTASLFRTDRAELEALLNTTGFCLVAESDHTAQLAHWHQQRYAALREAEDQLRAELEEGEWEQQLRRAETMVLLLESRVMTSTLLVLKKLRA